MNAIDTNVLVYFVDEHEPAKQAKATELLERLAKEETETALLWQVAVEFLSCLLKSNSPRRYKARTVPSRWHEAEATPASSRKTAG